LPSLNVALPAFILSKHIWEGLCNRYCVGFKYKIT
jgi:hypothetical protein